MRVCKMGLKSIWIDHAQGDVRLCAWTGYNLGNLQDYSIEELWHGRKAEQFRQSMLDGSYRFCNCQACPYIAHDELESVLVEYSVPEYPQICSLSYEEQCNYVCVFCRKEHYQKNDNEGRFIDKIEYELQKFISQLETISANGVGELFCSTRTLNLLGTIDTNKELDVILESNGSLFNRANWNKISNLGKYNVSVAITVHSFREDTYQFLSGTKMPIHVVIDNLHFVKELRKQNIINYFEIAVVVCERNFREMPEYIEYCLQEFEPDKIRLRFYIPYGVRSLAIEWFYDIRNTEHPYHEEYVKVMQHPIFEHEKVWKWQGETNSVLKQHPYFVEKKRADTERTKINIINYLLSTEGIADKIQSYFHMYEIKSFTLYGDSVITKILINILESSGMICNEILDTYRSNTDYRGHKIIQPSEENLKFEAVIITNISCKKDIEDKLIALGYKGKIIDIAKMIYELCNLIE